MPDAITSHSIVMFFAEFGASRPDRARSNNSLKGRASSRRGAGILLATGLAGCTVGPSYLPPPTDALRIPASFVETSVSEAHAASAVTYAWWRGFKDTSLDSLIRRALLNSTDLAAAMARLRIAEAVLRGVRGARLPALLASASASRSIDTTGGADALAAGSLLSGGVTGAFDIDLAGGLRRDAEAAEADTAAAGMDLDAARATLATALVVTYVDLRSAQARRAIAAAQQASQESSARIVAWRVRAGLAADGDYQSVHALGEQTAASVASFDEAARLAAHRLALLAGQSSAEIDAMLATSHQVPAIEALPRAGVPADLLRRRPDVRAAERRLAAETARIGVESSQLYPALRLNGSLTTSAGSAIALPGLALTTIAGALSAPLFRGGRIRARIEAQRGHADLALTDYRAAVLAAVADVEDALASVRAGEQRQARLAAAVSSADRALAQARDRYRGGLTDFQTLLDAERTSLAVRDAEAVARAARAQAVARLLRALGGGWTEARG